MVLKVGVYVDEETWAEMKKLTFRKYGTLRELSREVNRILRENLTLVALREGAKSIGVEPTKISEDQIVKGRPAMRGSSLEIIKEMRAGA
jgi:hypothetical protein